MRPCLILGFETWKTEPSRNVSQADGDVRGTSLLPRWQKYSQNDCFLDGTVQLLEDHDEEAGQTMISRRSMKKMRFYSKEQL